MNKWLLYVKDSDEPNAMVRFVGSFIFRFRAMRKLKEISHKNPGKPLFYDLRREY